MCGIAGVFNMHSNRPVVREELAAMAEAIRHRGPDEASLHVEEYAGFGFRRLSIIDVANGQQPFYSEDHSIVMICNGEIYNYRELRNELKAKGYQFRTNCDVEVIVHLYHAYGTDFISRLNGQFAFALLDKNNRSLLLARDQFGICPLFFTVADGVLVFGSEVKAILEHGLVKREVDLTALDQVLSLPGMVSPTTMFKNIESLKPGHYLQVRGGIVRRVQYWDLEYPLAGDPYAARTEASYAEQLEELLLRSVQRRLNADVPVGFYLSGGLDSSLIGALMKHLTPAVNYPSFSIRFPNLSDKQMDESCHQRVMARHLHSVHHEIEFDAEDIHRKLGEAVRHGECALRESYNTCSLALSRAAHDQQIKVVLSGEGADELFGGYVGYRLDTQRNDDTRFFDPDRAREIRIRQKLWGDPDFFYEQDFYGFEETKKALYSARVNEQYPHFNYGNRLEIDVGKLADRHVFHKRSYLDVKLRLSDHLIADHCDRVTYANSVEGRYPFLDTELVDFVRMIPPGLKLNGIVEKYILKEVARKYVPASIVNRQKFGFVAPGSPQLLRKDIGWINDLLSYETIRRQGYFDADAIERVKKLYKGPHFALNLPFENDLLMVVLTFNLFLQIFGMPDL
jgi:asparagine synthase (glutamine-hydrolysing)